MPQATVRHARPATIGTSVCPASRSTFTAVVEQGAALRDPDANRIMTCARIGTNPRSGRPSAATSAAGVVGVGRLQRLVEHGESFAEVLLGDRARGHHVGAV